MCAVDFLQAGEKLGGGYRNESCAVPEENREQAEVHLGKNSKHLQRQASDDAGKNQREKNEPAEKSLAGEAGAIESECGKQAQDEGKRNGAQCDEETVD